jgi:hypothetical protein
MNVGKTLFAQVMEFVPWKTFGRIIERHRGDSGVSTLGCADLFRVPVMAFAQLIWRESLRDVEVYLTANQSKLFHMGMKGVPARSTLSDALNLRDWRIYYALAMRLILRARDLYASDCLDTSGRQPRRPAFRTSRRSPPRFTGKLPTQHVIQSCTSNLNSRAGFV